MVPVLWVIGVARQQGKTLGIELWHDVLRHVLVVVAEHPLGIIGHIDAPRAIGAVRQLQLDDLYRGIANRKQPQALL